MSKAGLKRTAKQMGEGALKQTKLTKRVKAATGETKLKVGLGFLLVL